MLFNSIHFLIFFPIVAAIYFALPHRFRWLLLLTASAIFYMDFIPAYILILLFTIIVDYFAGILIEQSNDSQKRIYLLLSIFANVGTLAFFKYYNFTADTISDLARFLDWNYSLPALAIILPIGLSFYTFQAMSYTIEVYRGKQKAERHLGIYALYVMFFPQLVAGPIERPQNLIHQLKENHYFDYQRVTSGLKLMLWGLFKKIVIADRVAMVVNMVYGNPTNYEGIYLIIATILFSFQIYCDFSGYSDIAIGAAQVFGVKLMDNFKRPYFSKSIAEFWRRWHISLSSWFRDYVYIPLGGNRVSRFKWYRNIFLVFLISGLWHGSNWTFVAWGALHGFYLLFSIWTKNLRGKFAHFIKLDQHPILSRYIQVFITFFLVTFSWIFFRANTLAEALYIVKNLFAGLVNQLADIEFLRYRLFTEAGLGLSKTALLILFVSIIFMEIFHLVQRRGDIRNMLAPRPLWLRRSIYYGLIIWILLFGVFSNQTFIYFQF